MGKKVWLKTAPCQDLVLWQVAQSVPKPAAAWLGLVVLRYLERWQLEQAMDSLVKTPPAWQVAQASPECPRVSGKSAG